MKKKSFLIVLMVEAVLCVIGQFVVWTGALGISSIFSFPFAQIGEGLRVLSSSGEAGNVAAIVLYVLICCLPVLALLVISRRRRLWPEDGLLAVLGGLLFFVMYLMINPGLIAEWLGRVAGMGGSGKMIMGTVVYSVLAGYLVLVLLRRISRAELEQLQGYFRMILYVLGVIFVGAVFGPGVAGLRSSLASLVQVTGEAGGLSGLAPAVGEAGGLAGLTQAAGGSGNLTGVDVFGEMGLSAGTLNLSRAFLILGFAVDILPYLLDTVIVLTGLDLFEAFKADRYSEATTALAKKLAGQCTRMLAVFMISNISFNLLQLVFMKKLLAVESTVEFPIASILFVLAVLFLSKLLVENRELKEDNDLFV